MISQPFPQTDSDDPRFEADKASHRSSEEEHHGREGAGIKLTPEMCEELMDPEAWSQTLSSYARTVRLAVTLTDLEGRPSGVIRNAQPAWLVAETAKRAQGLDGGADGCSFCLDSLAPCQAVKTALGAGAVAFARDRVGLVHLAVPLLLGEHRVGAIIAGQAFDRYPDPLPLKRVARNLGISGEQLWRSARLQAPIRNATLQVYGELLFSLGKSFLRHRYADILDRNLAIANRRLGLLLNAIKDHALFTVDGTGAVTSWNQGAQRLYHHTESEVMGRNFSCLFTTEDIHAEVPAQLLKRANCKGWADDQGWQVRQDGTRFFAEGSLAVLGEGVNREFGRLTHDVTSRRSAEEALRQVQKLESIGILASGIAHDFNNLLCAILGSVSFAKDSLPPDHPAVAQLALAEQASERAADLTHQLLAYGGQGKVVVTRFDLSVLIQDMLNLLRGSIPRSVTLQLELRSDLPWMEADKSQIQQIVMNLVINGAESIGSEGGSLWVSTGTDSAEGDAGMEVWMKVRDSGSGMTEAVQARIFDPFFTTKFAGRGLGLAAVLGIVRAHAGKIHVESEVGKGSSFWISFPGVKPEVAGLEELALVGAEHIGGTVLVVDDEPSLRIMTQAILEESGYKVMVAANGLEGVEMFRGHADTITVILLDMTMPVMGGEEAFGLIRAVRADVPIVVSTGYSEGAARKLFSTKAFVGFIQKPYTAERLSEIIRTTSRLVRPVREAG